MTKYEWMRWFTLPIMPTLLATARKDISDMVSEVDKAQISILDVGGRKSPYTIGINAQVTIMDIPRETETQEMLKLGVSDKILAAIKRNRSNIKNIIIEDMTKTTLGADLFDAVVCVEVIEHVPEDEAFVANIAKVIKPGGWAYFTTPNGDYIKNEPPNYNPDHQRHYTKEQLGVLLARNFGKVKVRYAVKTGRYRWWGLSGYTIRKPWRTVKSILGNVINRYESKGLDQQKSRTAHLIAIAIK